MFTPKAHIIVIDSIADSPINSFTFELATTLLYNAQRTAIVLDDDSPLWQTVKKRLLVLPQLLSPALIHKKDFCAEADKYNAIIIPNITSNNELAVMASTYITILPKQKKELNNFIRQKEYINNIFELKKKIASAYARSLNWIVCEYNHSQSISDSPSPKITELARIYGFRAAPPFNNRIAYQNNINGISAQDKSLPILKKELTYEDICAKREIIKLAEFIFS